MSSSVSHGLKLKTTQILVVDDNPTALRLLESILEKEGYLVSTATNGKEALDMLQGDPEGIDVIVLDRMMPEMDGLEVVRRMQADRRFKYIPVIMETAADKPEEISEGISAGVFYYLTKPIERKTLVSVVAAAVKESEQRRQLRAEMARHHMGFGLIQVMKTRFRTLEEAESLASFLAHCFPDQDRALTGISELLINAVEHGNLEISYEEKSRLVEAQQWRQEVERRLADPKYGAREVVAIFERKDKAYYLQVTDEGPGFNWRGYLEFDPSRASHNHGRGIAMANMIAFDRLVYNDKGNQVTAVMYEPDPEGNGDDYWG